MSSLLIPVAPFSTTKSRLQDCFSAEKLKDFTIAMFKDLVNTLADVNCFEHKIVYCNASEILEIAEENGYVLQNPSLAGTIPAGPPRRPVGITAVVLFNSGVSGIHIA